MSEELTENWKQLIYGIILQAVTDLTRANRVVAKGKKVSQSASNKANYRRAYKYNEAERTIISTELWLMTDFEWYASIVGFSVTPEQIIEMCRKNGGNE